MGRLVENYVSPDRFWAFCRAVLYPDHTRGQAKSNFSGNHGILDTRNALDRFVLGGDALDASWRRIYLVDRFGGDDNGRRPFPLELLENILIQVSIAGGRPTFAKIDRVCQ